MTQAKLTGSYSVFGIDSYAASVAHYVDWLGFNLDWEWRAAPEAPAIVSLSRDSVSLMLNEADAVATGSQLTVFVDDLQALVDEWNARGSDAVAVSVQPPYDIPSVVIADAAGNRINFQQPIDEAEEERRDQLRAAMRDWVRARLDAGEDPPTAEQLVEAVGRPLGLAIEVVQEFADR